MRKSELTLQLLITIWMLPVLAAQAYETGHTSMTFTDSDRGRQIPVEIYYPADSAGDNVPVADGGATGFPVLSFGHGYMMPWSAYANIWSSVVPEGYIIIFPKTAGELFPDHQQFGRDLAFVITALQNEGANSSSLFYQKTGQTSAVMGHSMGGGASFLAAAADSTISALVNLAAAETSPSAIQAAGSIEIPALLFAGSGDCVTPPASNQTPMYSALASGCKTLLTLAGASHCQFAENNLTCSLGEITCPAPGISRAQQHALVDQLLLPWLAAVLKDDESAGLHFENLLTSLAGISVLRDCPSMTGVPEPEQSSIPSTFPGRNFPNPFNPVTTFPLNLPGPGTVTLRIFDILGQPVTAQQYIFSTPGRQQISWDAGNLAGGTYLAVISYSGANGGKQLYTQKLILKK